MDGDLLGKPAASGAAHWHQLDAEGAALRLQTDPRLGLDPSEVPARQRQYGLNQMSERRRTPAWLRFLLQFHQPLLYILLAASLVTAFLQEWIDAGVIFGVVLVNAIVGYIQESRAEKAMEALARMVKTEATVRRGGEKLRLPSLELVPGDVVLLQGGDRVPADLRLTRVRNLQIDESALTGESVPVEKQLEPLPPDTLLGDQSNRAFTGTLATFGQGEGIVVATGDRTETGRIAQMLSDADVLATPLTRKIAQFSRVLMFLILGLAALTFAGGIFRGGDAFDVFMAAVALAVAAIPEGLPAAVTITLAIGVARMARRRAIVRKLPAVETLGSTTVICSDKTGTLTQNQMTVQEIFAGGRLFHVSGSGYEPVGAIHHQGEVIETASNVALVETLGAGMLCNDAQLVQVENRFSPQGDPTEVALLVAGRKGGFHEARLLEELPRVEVIPFESEYRYMATLHGGNGREGKRIYLKGAVETLIEKCAHQMAADGNPAPLDREGVLAEAERMARQGLRVLAFARREVPSDHHGLQHEDIAGELTFLGLQGKIDPPRPEAIAAVDKCQQAGIQVKMITGDHVLTARAIAEQMALGKTAWGDGEVPGELVAVTGQELTDLSEDELAELAGRAAVFARVAPEQKLALVRALQARGHFVAMTGDGVNDAPALKQADIGVAMGITGTDVAKEAADIVLTDDNFATIEAAVEEGRGIFDNLTKFIIWTLPTNAGQGLIILSAIFAGLALPLLPVQLLWVNMTTALLLGLMLVFEPKEADLMRRPPRDPKAPIFTFPMFMRTGLVTLLMLGGAFGLFFWQLEHPGIALEEARTAVVNVIVMVQTFYLFNCRRLTASAASAGWFSNRILLLGVAGMMTAQMLFTYTPLMNRLFQTAPVRLETWGFILLTGFTAFVFVEVEKWVRSRKRKA